MRALIALLLFGALLTPAAAQADLKRGETLVRQSCSACHAVGRTGDSPVAEAPQFRLLGQKYPIANLQEALAEGIAVGHRGVQMPEYTFEPDQIDAIIAYLESIQVR
jgi:mono/diheme cytochrome c family protein